MTEKLSTGIEGLDRLTDGGFRRGSAYIVQGPPGAGKTILANQFCYAHVRNGGRALYMSLLAESSDRMLAYVRQMAFFDEDVVPGRLQYVSGYGVLEREGLLGLSKLIQHELKRHQATAMVLDGTFVAQSVASEHEFRAFIHGLQGVATAAGAVLVMLTHQARLATSPEHTMVDGWIEMSNETVGYRAVQHIQVRKQRGAAIIGGKHSFRISEKGITVFPRAESCVPATPSAAHSAGSLGSGLPDLDALIGGGLPSESATLVLGPTGSGKTTLGLHFLSEATPQAPALMFGFYETPARLRVRARGLGFDLDGMIDSGALELIWWPPAEILPDEVVHEIVHRARVIGARRVFVDGLAALRDGLNDRERLPYIVNALSHQLRDMGATVLYALEIRELGFEASMPSDELSAMIDNVLLLNLSRHDQAARRYLSIVKMRSGDFDPYTRQFHIGNRGFVLTVDERLQAFGRAE
ncbi:MAG TPA: ATPase domain-containing protein [Dyella sp.]|uniref:RAD55 family ATPase n=1 Tax=Dyella sp. TaxID=1869338 RepID=UPI002F945422